MQPAPGPLTRGEGEEDGGGDSDVRDDFCFVLAFLPKERLARFIAQVRRVARSASETAFRAWRARAGAAALRCGTIGQLLGTALEQVCIITTANLLWVSVSQGEAAT